MPNIVFTSGIGKRNRGEIDFNAVGTVVRVMLEDADLSTYVPNKDHDNVSDLTAAGFVECTAEGYARQTIANKAVNDDDANDRVEVDFDDVNFGALAAGQVVKGYAVYVQTGGDDSTPADDQLLWYVDTATGLPATLGGGEFKITINAEGHEQISQV